MNKNMCPGRRDFLKMSIAGTAGIALASGGVHKVFAASSRTAAGTAPLNKWRGRVVINFNKSAPSGNVAPNATQITLIKTMVDDSIKLLTGLTDIGAAWKSVFPASLSLTSKIAIKVPPGVNSSLTTTHWASVQAITEGLEKMDFGGTKFPAANITIYDGGDGAAHDNLNACGFNSTNFPGLGGFIFESMGTNYTDGAEDNATTPVKQQYSTVLHDANFLINVFSPRGHGAYAENFTLGFKNHYGTYNCVYHDSPNTSQFLRNICCTGPVYNRTVLLMCSGIYGQYESNGPTGTPQNYNRYSKYMDTTSTNTNPTTIIMGTDPVSVEMQTIKMMRIQGQGLYAVADMPNYLKASGGVVVSGTNWPPNPSLPNAMDNIGEINETNMTVRYVINGVVAVKERPSAQAINSGAFVSATQIKGHNSTFIEFALPESHTGKIASVEIYNLKGTLVTKLSHRVGGVLNHLSWNETNASGSHVGIGAYVVRLVSEGVDVSSKFSIAR
jgi:hypothetical protein